MNEAVLLCKVATDQMWGRTIQMRENRAGGKTGICDESGSGSGNGTESGLELAWRG